MSLKLNYPHVVRNVNTKAGNQKNFNDMKGDTRATWATVRPGVKGKWGDGPLFQALKQIAAKLDTLYKEVRVGVTGKHSDGPLARLIRSSRNDVQGDIAELNAKLDRVINKIGA